VFSQILSGLTLVRHAVAITLVMGAATATVAGAVDMSQNATVRTVPAISASTVTAEKTETNTTDLEAAVNACLETKDPASEACANAVTLSGLSSETFWAKIALSLKAQLVVAKGEKNAPKTDGTRTPKPENTTRTSGELVGLVTACVASHERASEPCAKALELSGLSADEFWAKLGAMFATTQATPAPKTTEGLSVLIGACLAKFEAARKGTYSEPISTSEACRKAFEATGLTPEQFYAKFVTKQTSSDKPQPTTRSTEGVTALIKECLAAYERARDTHEGGEAASDACRKAIEASGLSANEFWAKFAPKPATTPKPEPTTRPTPTAKPTTQQTVTEAQLLVMVKDCFAKYVAATTAKGDESLGHAAYEACTSAIAASGLSNEAFWAKFGTPQAPKI